MVELGSASEWPVDRPTLQRFAYDRLTLRIP
jgi:hypothetical protein